jgi:hypothetical protein
MVRRRKSQATEKGDFSRLFECEDTRIHPHLLRRRLQGLLFLTDMNEPRLTFIPQLVQQWDDLYGSQLQSEGTFTTDIQKALNSIS